MSARKCNLGCGHKILHGWVNLDKVPLPGVDIVHDILKPPYPFPDNHFDYILASHVLEHIPQQLNETDGLLLVVAELHRILKPGGVLEVRGPHPRLGIYYFNNPTHYRVITQWTFDSLVWKEHSSCVSYWSNIRFSKLTWMSDSFTDPPFNSELLKSAMQRVPFLKRIVGRPVELVIKLTK